MEHIAGMRILLTRAADDNGPWIERLRSLGAEAVPLPCITIECLQVPADWESHLETSHWVAFTSYRAVQMFADILDDKTLAAHQIAAVGPTTRAACLTRFGRCDLSSKDGTGGSLVDALAPKLVKDAGVLIPCAAEARPELVDGINANGARAFPMPIYATRAASIEGAPLKLTKESIDAVLFASPSAVDGASAITLLPQDIPVSCIGPTTAEAARSAGFTRVATSGTRDLDGLLSALRELITQEPQTR